MLLKICGMTRQEDIIHASECGFNLCGFIFHKASKRYVNPDKAACLASSGLKRVGVFVCSNLDEIESIAFKAKLDLIQLHGEQPVALAAALGPERVIRVLWPEKYASKTEFYQDAEKHAQSCAWYLLDAGTSGGGHGRELVWQHFADLALPRPWLLAGGLTPLKLNQVLKACKPDGLDFNSGLEISPGIKDQQKMRQVSDFVQSWEAMKK